MGLLDAAIRDHLELKRLRGADPDEVAREQEEALAPVLDVQDVEVEEEPFATESFDLEPDGSSQVDATSEGDAGMTAPPAQHADPPQGGQETAELDMRAVLGESEGAPVESLSSGGPSPAGFTEVAPVPEDRQ
jgi:hypothetical protein